MQTPSIRKKMDEININKNHSEFIAQQRLLRAYKRMVMEGKDMQTKTDKIKKVNLKDNEELELMIKSSKDYEELNEEEYILAKKHLSDLFQLYRRNISK